MSSPPGPSAAIDPVATPPAAAAAVQEVVRGWDRGFRLHLLYQGNNPAVERFIEILRRQVTALWEELPELTVVVEENSLRWGDLPVYAAETGTDNLAFLLFRDGIREITLLPGFEEDELATWISLLARVYRTRGDEEDLLTLLWEGDWQSLRYRYVDPAADAVQLPAATNALPPAIAAPGRSEPEPSPATVQPDDFQGALFFLDDSEMRGIAAELREELSRDLIEGVVFALLDRFEDAKPDRQHTILDILTDLLPVLLGAGHVRHALALLEELHTATSPPQRSAPSPGVEKLFQAVAAPETLAELVRVAEDVPEVAASDAFPRLLGFLPPVALEPLVRLGAETQVQTIRGALAAAAYRLALEHPGAIRPLLGSADVPLLVGAAQLAGRLGRSELAEPLVKLLEQPTTEVRLAAIEALQRLKTTLGASALERALDDPEREVRVAAARSLAELRYSPARKSLERMLDSKRLHAADLTERIAFHEAYGSVADADGVKRLDRVLNGRDWIGRRAGAEERACAALALGRSRLPDARQSLAGASADPDPVVRSAVSRAMRGGSA